MRQRLEPRQAEKPAGPLDGVHQAKNIIENLRIVRILLEPNKLHVDHVETLVRLRQELTQQIIHGRTLPGARAYWPHLREIHASVLGKRLILVAGPLRGPAMRTNT